jgi:hypothetical protein
VRGALRTAIPLLAFLVLGSALISGNAEAKKRKPLKVSCEQLYAEIERTGAQLQAQYNAMGFTIGVPDPLYPSDPPPDGFTAAERCRKFGKRVRQGVGFMNDVYLEGPFFPGETNPAIREYFWTWTQTVTRTKKGKLRSAIVSLRCEKYIYEGPPSQPSGTQTLPC